MAPQPIPDSSPDVIGFEGGLRHIGSDSAVDVYGDVLLLFEAEMTRNLSKRWQG